MKRVTPYIGEYDDTLPVTITKKDSPNWLEGIATINGKKYWFQAKVFENPSTFGIKNGRISKLVICPGDTWKPLETIYRYDRGLNQETEEGSIVVDFLLKVFPVSASLKVRYVALAMNVIAVAKQGGRGDDWAAYIGAVPGKCHADEWKHVLEYGEKLPEKVAAVIFPEFAEAFIWRR
jgi:hypothetical protein